MFLTHFPLRHKLTYNKSQIYHFSSHTVHNKRQRIPTYRQSGASHYRHEDTQKKRLPLYGDSRLYCISVL